MSSFELILPYFSEHIQGLILEPSISDLMFTEGKLFLDWEGNVYQDKKASYEPRDLDSAVESIARQLGQDINSLSPILDSRLPDGSRVAAVFPPASPNGTTLTIRKFTRNYTLAELIEKHTISYDQAQKILEAANSGKNILISGGTSSGKTTLLNAIVNELSPDERYVVIEKPAELKIGHTHVVRWEAVDELTDRPAITTAQLVRAALRHRPDRIIVGEVRDGSAYDLLQAMNTGHGGSLSTVHANSALNALYRLSALATSAHPNLSAAFMRQETATAINLVVHVERSGGKRTVKEVLEVVGYVGDNFEVKG